MGEISEIFRAYDIRGNTEEELTPETMERIGRAYGTFQVENGSEKVVVGHDARQTSEELKDAFINGIRTTGVEKIVDLGLEPFGVVLFYGWRHGFESAYVTASHLPPEWNGVKFYHPDGVGYLEEENHGIRDIFIEKDFREGEDAKIREMDYRTQYIQYVTSKVDGGDLDILMDCGNGVAGLTAPKILRNLGFDVDVINKEPDGTFPNRESDVNKESISELIDKVGEYDLGLAYDGDSDRCFLITPEGRLLDADETAYIVLDQLLRENPGKVVANVECSMRLEEAAEKHNSEVERVRVGHTYLFKAIKEEKGVFGVERAGHFAVPEIFPLDDGVAASAYFASLVSEFDDLSSEVEGMPSYFGDRIPFKCDDSVKFKVVEELQQELGDQYENTSTVDGVRVEFEDGWVLIRASNTSPKIRITLEAETEKRFKELKEEFSEVLKEKISSHEK